MELPPPEELADWLRHTRSEHDITQTELAERADVSPSQISRIESQQGGTAYTTMYRIQQEVLALTTPDTTQSVADILTGKHATYSSDYQLITASPNDSVNDVLATMQELSISQLPVLTDDGSSVGRITDRDLLAVTHDSDPVEDYMRPPFPEVTADIPASLARELVETTEAILVTPGDTDLSPVGDHGYVGLLTPTDFAEHQASPASRSQ